MLLKPIPAVEDELLIVQDRYSQTPPREFPCFDAGGLEAGSTVLLSDWRRDSLMCSRMKITRFADGNRMPPPELYSKLEAFLSEAEEPTPHDSAWSGE